MATILKRSLNPAKKFRETKGSPHARAYRTTMKQKCKDAFLFFNGNIISKRVRTTVKRPLGILDYLFFPLSLLSYKCIDAADRGGNIFFGILGLVIGSPKYLVSSILTFLSLPFITIAHIISKSKGLKLINTINNAPVHVPMPAPASAPVAPIAQQNDDAQTTTSILSHLRAQGAAPNRAFDILVHKHNFAELVKDQHGNTTGFTLFIGRPLQGYNHQTYAQQTYPNDVVDAQGNIIHRAGDPRYINPSVTFIEAQLNAEQIKAMIAIRKLNIGGVQKLIEDEEKQDKSALTIKL